MDPGMGHTLSPEEDHVNAALRSAPYPITVWGDTALVNIGARIFSEDIYLVLEDEDIPDACARLRGHAFRDAPWSFGVNQEALRRLTPEARKSAEFGWDKFDNQTSRFLFPLSTEMQGRLILLPTSYAQISTRSDPANQFVQRHGWFWPQSTLLLHSFVKTLVREPTLHGEPNWGLWLTLLMAWASFYLYSRLYLPNDIFDTCRCVRATTFFMHRIRRPRPGDEGWRVLAPGILPPHVIWT